MNLIDYLSQPGITHIILADAINDDAEQHPMAKPVTPGAISHWAVKERRRLAGESDRYGVPPDRVLQLVRVSRVLAEYGVPGEREHPGVMEKHLLRPDLYQLEVAAA